jgi:hypothetical protein
LLTTLALFDVFLLFLPQILQFFMNIIVTGVPPPAAPMAIAMAIATAIATITL